VEFANWYTPKDWLTLDADFAWSRTYFTDAQPTGNYVPASLALTFDGGVAVHDLPGIFSGWSAGLRLRYFGPRPLIEDASVKSRATTILNGNIGYDFANDWSVGLNIYNLLDARVSDIDYYYTSRLPGEPAAGYDDVHTHPAEPRELRISLTRRF
jgi:outer membrane receptor protein involved in Fe transport